MEMSRESAAKVALHFQKLDQPRPKAAPSSVVETVRSLGNIQIDTINVVERSPHLVLHSRLDDYRAKLLDEALYKQRKLCEYFTNVAAIIPIEDYPHYFYGWYLRRSPNNWVQTFWLPKNQEYVEKVRREVPRSAAFSTDHFDASLQRREHGWSGSELTRALDYLLLSGYLMIHHREGSRRFYARRVPLDTSDMDDHKLLRFLLKRALDSMGIGTLREIQLARFMPSSDYELEIKSMLKDGTIEVLRIKGHREDYYLISEQKEEVQVAAEKPFSDDRATLLSPFDNLIINRQRTFKLFGFYPRFEAYVPKDKRKFGYYNMPILYQSKLLGYIDPKLDRKTCRMTFQTIHLDHLPDGQAQSALVEEFTRFLLFHDAEELEVRNSQPANLGEKIEAEVNRTLRA